MPSNTNAQNTTKPTALTKKKINKTVRIWCVVVVVFVVVVDILPRYISFPLAHSPPHPGDGNNVYTTYMKLMYALARGIVFAYQPNSTHVPNM